MTKEEFLTVATRLKAAYPWAHFLEDAYELDTWYLLLQDMPANLLEAAALKYILSQSKPPAVSDLRATAVGLMQGSELTPLASWSRVFNALSNSNYHAQEEFDKLTPLEQRALGSPATLVDWAKADIKSLSVIQSQYISAYKAAQIQQNTDSALPEKFKELLGEHANKQLEVKEND